MSESSRTITWQDPRPTAAVAMELSGLEFLSQIVSGQLPPPPISQTLGFQLVEVREGEAFFQAKPDDSHYNPIGVVHAGLAMTMLDSAAACAVHTTLPVELAYTSLETKVSFLRAVTSAAGTLTAHGWVTKPGRRAAFAESDLRDEEGVVYATASSTCFVYPVG